MNVAQGGGIFTTFTVPRGSDADSGLRAINRDLIAALGLVRGVAHAEFIQAHADGHFYFLECAARVGGAYINEMVEAATGINLWREWARIEIAGSDGSYQLPPVREEYAGVILSLARQDDPDTSAYDDPEVVYRIKRHHHAGLILRSMIRSGCDVARKLQPAICGGVYGSGTAAGKTYSVSKEFALTTQKNTSGETWNRRLSTPMCSVVRLAFPRRTSETMLGVPNTSNRSFCFRLFVSISSFKTSIGLAALSAKCFSSKSSISNVSN